MRGTVRTSYTVRASAEGIDNPSCEGERDRFDEPTLMLDEDSPVMRGERGHDVLLFQFSADEVFCAVELDRAVTVDLADERDATLGDWKNQVPAGIDVRIEREAVREMAEGRPGPIAKNSGEPGPMVGQGEASAGLLDVVVAKEAPARPAQSPQIGTRMKKHAFLPEPIEALDGRVSTGLSRRNEEKMNAQEEMEADNLGEAVAIASSSRRVHLVIHLGDPGKLLNSPGINQMTTKRDRSLVAELTGCGGLSGDINGMDGIEASDSSGPSEMTGPDQVGLLKVAHLTSQDIGIGRSAGSTLDLDLLCLAGLDLYLLDGQDSGEPTYSSSLNLEMDRFGADAGESRPAALMGRQLVAESQYLPDERLSRPISDMFRNSTLVPKTVEAKGLVSVNPLRQPPSTSTDCLQRPTESSCLLIDSNRVETNRIFPAFFHRHRLLPNDLGRSLGDIQNGSRCPYGLLYAMCLRKPNMPLFILLLSH